MEADVYMMKDTQNDDEKGFDMSPSLAHNIYTQNNVGIESPAKLIAMLYEGVLRFNAQAKKAIKDGDIEKKFYWRNRSIAVISELISVLDMEQEGDISVYLVGLYNYEIQLLSQAAAYSEPKHIDEVSNVFKGLLEAWREATDVAN
jgi:flagellar protein FliS